MSKPGSMTDIEGVLTSVRRLVDDKQTQGSRADTPHSMERLVLSPQLRVAKGDVLRLEAKHAVRSIQEPDGASDMGLTGARDAKPDASDQPISHATQAGPSQELDAFSFSMPPSPDAAKENASDLDATSIGGKDLMAKIAALETVIAKTADQWEPDGMGRDAYAGTQSKTMSWQDSVELDARGKPVAGSSARGATTSDDGKLTQDHPAHADFLDDEALRDLVAAVVHSELQGALGERITRNIRKLVRREIHRALAARELD